jgi:hypothetical protein
MTESPPKPMFRVPTGVAIVVAIVAAEGALLAARYVLPIWFGQALGMFGFVILGVSGLAWVPVVAVWATLSALRSPLAGRVALALLICWTVIVVVVLTIEIRASELLHVLVVPAVPAAWWIVARSPRRRTALGIGRLVVLSVVGAELGFLAAFFAGPLLDDVSFGLFPNPGSPDPMVPISLAMLFVMPPLGIFLLLALARAPAPAVTASIGLLLWVLVLGLDTFVGFTSFLPDTPNYGLTIVVLAAMAAAPSGLAPILTGWAMDPVRPLERDERQADTGPDRLGEGG